MPDIAGLLPGGASTKAMTNRPQPIARLFATTIRLQRVSAPGAEPVPEQERERLIRARVLPAAGQEGTLILQGRGEAESRALAEVSSWSHLRLDLVPQHVYAVVAAREEKVFG